MCKKKSQNVHICTKEKFPLGPSNLMKVPFHLSSLQLYISSYPVHHPLSLALECEEESLSYLSIHS